MVPHAITKQSLDEPLNRNIENYNMLLKNLIVGYNAVCLGKTTIFQEDSYISLVLK